jgi:hypothetical protein
MQEGIRGAWLPCVDYGEGGDVFVREWESYAAIYLRRRLVLDQLRGARLSAVVCGESVQEKGTRSRARAAPVGLRLRGAVWGERARVGVVCRLGKGMSNTHPTGVQRIATQQSMLK